ncbi:MAG: hypothetical protein K0S99_2166 [Thermomicrobiales bacterium]|jgi:hypothetical protein|nr:hypothetical protein [Thermomicrobiales bacterium]
MSPPPQRIATAPPAARSILTAPGHGSAEHRSAWTPSDPRTSLLACAVPCGSAGSSVRGEQERTAQLPRTRHRSKERVEHVTCPLATGPSPAR